MKGKEHPWNEGTEKKTSHAGEYTGKKGLKRKHHERENTGLKG